MSQLDPKPKVISLSDPFYKGFLGSIEEAVANLASFAGSMDDVRSHIETHISTFDEVSPPEEIASKLMRLIKLEAIIKAVLSGEFIEAGSLSEIAQAISSNFQDDENEADPSLKPN